MVKFESLLSTFEDKFVGALELLEEAKVNPNRNNRERFYEEWPKVSVSKGAIEVEWHTTLFYFAQRNPAKRLAA